MTRCAASLGDPASSEDPYFIGASILVGGAWGFDPLSAAFTKSGVTRMRVGDHDVLIECPARCAAQFVEQGSLIEFFTSDEEANDFEAVLSRFLAAID